MVYEAARGVWRRAERKIAFGGVDATGVAAAATRTVRAHQRRATWIPHRKPRWVGKILDDSVVTARIRAHLTRALARRPKICPAALGVFPVCRPSFEGAISHELGSDPAACIRNRRFPAASSSCSRPRRGQSTTGVSAPSYTWRPGQPARRSGCTKARPSFRLSPSAFRLSPFVFRLPLFVFHIPTLALSQFSSSPAAVLSGTPMNCPRRGL